MRKLLYVLFLLPSVAAAFMPDDEIAILQRTSAGWSTGERIAFWAEQFIGIPYDPDPLGEYVRNNVVVADERIDCMYHAFRSVELALGKDPADSITVALDKRFHGRGLIEGGKISNYGERFRYGEDMLESGKWGREITTELGDPVIIKGGRGRPRIAMIRRQDIPKIMDKLQSGDLVFFVKDPKKRVSGEIIGHLGIIKNEAEITYLVSAFGRKNRGGTVRKIPLSEYGREMPFVGIRVSRLE
ncbi:MAG: hypothetical protein HZA15_02040 [Nitrospirae bacterium]|nr:hypothetical protein [Nitrospirota bacterium]